MRLTNLAREESWDRHRGEKNGKPRPNRGETTEREYMVSAMIVQSAFYSGFLMKITLPLIYLRVKTTIDCDRF